MSKYREELVRTIKAMGQELIDRAESMVHGDCEMITNFNINIDIPQPMDGSPEITWSTSVVSKNFYEKGFNHTAGDAKMETHIESVTVEKNEGYWKHSYSPIDDRTILQCSECGHIEIHRGLFRTSDFPDICSDCGAKMDLRGVTY
jgi:hypothetical protein